MTHTCLVLPPEMIPQLSTGYRAMQGKVDAETPLRNNQEGPGYGVPNGAIYTTVGDMARFASFLMGDGPDSVLNKSALDSDLTQIAIQADFQLDSGYGMGDYMWRRHLHGFRAPRRRGPRIPGRAVYEPRPGGGRNPARQCDRGRNRYRRPCPEESRYFVEMRRLRCGAPGMQREWECPVLPREQRVRFTKVSSSPMHGDGAPLFHGIYTASIKYGF